MATVVTTPKVGHLGDLARIFGQFWGSEHGRVESLGNPVRGGAAVSARVIVWAWVTAHDADSRELFGDVSQRRRRSAAGIARTSGIAVCSWGMMDW